MDNQYNQQPAPQQVPQQQVPQPQYQPQYAPPPPRLYVDPAIAKKQKKDAFEAFSEKTAAVMRTNPVLGFVSKYSDIISYIVTGVSALITIISMCLGNFSIILSLTTLIFGAFAVSKKQMLPLTIAISCLSLFSLVCLINTIAEMASYGRYFIYSSFLGSYIIALIFGIVELAIIGYLTFVCWTYFLAVLPPKAYQPVQPYYGQPYYGQPQAQQPAQPMQPQQQTAPMQTAVPMQPAAPVQPAGSAQSAVPVQSAAPVQVAAPAQPASQKFCSSCGSANAEDSAFCKICGTKL